jgi:CRISPR/Cas system-associated exonuclease Cas4 (RecB family)
MKSITTLVDDIYSLISKDKPLSEAQVEALGKSLTETLKRRLSDPPEPRGLSMSSIGSKCKRQLWYKINQPEKAEPLEPKARLNFLAGDIWEEILLCLAKAAGHTVEGEQDELELYGVKGHRDAVIDGVTVDVKTANSRSMEKFKNHDLEKDDPFGYLSQLSCYVTAAERVSDPLVQVRSEGAFLVADKERGGLTLDRYQLKPVSEDEVNAVKVLVSSKHPPARRYSPEPDGKSGNQVIPMPCRYCAFKETCWADANQGRGLLKYIFSSGPKWFTKIVRDPKPRVEQF